jgi:hypothetical protein
LVGHALCASAARSNGMAAIPASSVRLLRLIPGIVPPVSL